MRVAMIGTRGYLSQYSGIETLLRGLCPRLVKRGYSVTVFGDQTSAAHISGVNLEPVPALRQKHLETLSRSAISTLRATRQRFDILHFHDVAPAFFAAFARRLGKPTVLTLHSLDWKRAKWSWISQQAIRFVERVAVSNSNQITVVSETLQHYLLEQYGLNSMILPPVTNAAVFTGPTTFSASLQLKPREYILFAARLTQEKAPHELIEAFKTLNTDFKLVVVGSPGYDRVYERTLKNSSRGANIVFTGHIATDHLHELYSNAYLFVLPSHIEGRSMSILEALAHGAAVLVSDIPENEELVREYGYTFRTGNISDLAERLAWLIAHPDDVQSMRDRTALLMSQQITWDELADGYDLAYQEAYRGGLLV